jgi:hypothetical protein
MSRKQPKMFTLLFVLSLLSQTLAQWTSQTIVGTISALDCTADTKIVYLATGSSGLQIAMLADNGILSLTSAGGSSATFVARGGNVTLTGNDTNLFLYDGTSYTAVPLPPVQTTGVNVTQSVTAMDVSNDGKLGIAIAEVPAVGSGVYGYVFTKSGSDWTLIGNGVGYYNSMALSKDGSSVAAAYKASRMNGPGALQTFTNGIQNPPINVTSLNETQWTNVAASRQGNDVWACRTIGNATHSADWGRTWSNSTFSCDSIAVVNSNNLWAIKGGVLSASRDGGKTWNTEIPSDVSGVCASDDNLTVFAATEKGLSYESANRASNAYKLGGFAFAIVLLL